MRIAFQAAIAVILAAAPAAHAGYTLTPVKVRGKPAASVDVISAAGSIGGTYRNGAGVQLGYLLAGGVVSTLKPNANFDNPRPTGINDKGVVAGLGYLGSNSVGFLWKDGHYENKKTWSVSLGEGYQTIVSINSKSTVAFNTTSRDNTAYHGKKYPFQAIPIFSGDFPFVDNINRSGMTAGYYANYPLSSIFTCTSDDVITTVQGPGNTSAYDGFINDSGAVAGVYQGSGSVTAGFVLDKGIYTTFDIPAAVGRIYVTGFSNTGIVVGTYTDAAGASHGFAWRAGHFSELVPNPSASQSVTIAGVDDSGDVALDLTVDGITTPYVARCSHGC